MCDRRLQQSGSTDTQLLTNESTNPPVTRLGERFNFKNQSIALLVYRSTNGIVSSFFPSNGNIVIILRDFNINTTAVNVSRTLKYCFWQKFGNKNFPNTEFPQVITALFQLSRSINSWKYLTQNYFCFLISMISEKIFWDNFGPSFYICQAHRLNLRKGGLTGT